MVEQLFGSKTRVKLLSLFLNNPNRPFYVREITRKIDEQINSVRRELANLLSIGIIKSEGAKNRLYYEINQKYPYYEQLRSIFSTAAVKTKKETELKEEDHIAKMLRTTGTVDYAFLTGTFVRESRVNTDIVIIGDVNRAKLAKVIADIEREMGRELNFSLMTPKEYEYRLSLNDRFLASIVAAKKIVVIDGQETQMAPGADSVEVKIETAAK